MSSQQAPRRAAALKPAAAKPAGRAAAPQRHVETTWEDTGSVKTETITKQPSKKAPAKPVSVLTQRGFKMEPLPERGEQEAENEAPAAQEPAAQAPEHKAGEGRLVCPNCGGTSFNVITDKTRPVSYGVGSGMGTMYAKVHQCKKCGAKVD
jgi:hypothetical protein